MTCRLLLSRHTRLFRLRLGLWDNQREEVCRVYGRQLACYFGGQTVVRRGASIERPCATSDGGAAQLAVVAHGVPIQRCRVCTHRTCYVYAVRSTRARRTASLAGV